MRFFSDLIKGIREPSAEWLLLNWLCTRVSFLIGAMRRISLASCLGSLSAYSRTPQGLAVLCIYWIVFLVAVVCVSILLTLWETHYADIELNLTVASHAEKSLDGWTARRLYCYPPQLCGESSNIFLEGRSSLKFETLLPEPWRYSI